MKYTESEYQKEYNEIIEVYEEQMKPLKIPWLIAFISICTIASTMFLLDIIPLVPWRYLLWHYRAGDYQAYYFIFCMIYIVPGTYIIRLRQVKRHKKRLLQNLEDKKMGAVSCGNFDANA